MTVANGNHLNLKKRYTVFWGLADVRILAASSEPPSEFDSAIIHVLLPLTASREHCGPVGYIRKRATALLRAELSEHGYELKYLDELMFYGDVEWQAEEDAKFYRALAAQVLDTKKVQLGRVHLYLSLDTDEED